MDSAAAPLEGTVASWHDSRGFGFITPVDGGQDVFVHISEFPGAKRPRIGEPLTFLVEHTSGGKSRARLVLPDGAVPVGGPRPWKPASRHSIVGYFAIAAFAALYLYVGVERELPLWVTVLYVGASIISFLVYAADKSAATTGQWRTSESTLLVVGIIGGWPGAIVAQQVLRHKTRKTNFQLAFWGTVALNIAAFVTFTSPNLIGLLSPAI